jgi:hypothetical protein
MPKLYIACIRGYSYIVDKDNGLCATYMGQGVTTFESHKELLDAYIDACTSSTPSMPSAEDSYEVRDYSNEYPTISLKKLFAKFYTPVWTKYGTPTNEETILVDDGQEYATLKYSPDGDHKVSFKGISVEHLSVERVVSLQKHAQQILARHIKRFNKRFEQEQRKNELENMGVA